MVHHDIIGRGLHSSTFRLKLRVPVTDYTHETLKKRLC